MHSPSVPSHCFYHFISLLICIPHSVLHTVLKFHSHFQQCHHCFHQFISLLIYLHLQCHHTVVIIFCFSFTFSAVPSIFIISHWHSVIFKCHILIGLLSLQCPVLYTHFNSYSITIFMFNHIHMPFFNWTIDTAMSSIFLQIHSIGPLSLQCPAFFNSHISMHIQLDHCHCNVLNVQS